jgi:5-methylcytosine-specific restriction protein A
VAEWPYNTATWRKLREAHLSLDPTCRGCRKMGRLVIANTVDHAVPVSAGGHPFPGHDGLVSYCPSCHSAKTARGSEAGAARSAKPRRGCDANGNPLDPSHPWKSLRAEGERARGNRKTQLVSKGNRNG